MSYAYKHYDKASTPKHGITISRIHNAITDKRTVIEIQAPHKRHVYTHIIQFDYIHIIQFDCTT